MTQLSPRFILTEANTTNTSPTTTSSGRRSPSVLRRTNPSKWNTSLPRTKSPSPTQQHSNRNLQNDLSSPRSSSTPRPNRTRIESASTSTSTTNEVVTDDTIDENTDNRHHYPIKPVLRKNTQEKQPRNNHDNGIGLPSWRKDGWRRRQELLREDEEICIDRNSNLKNYYEIADRVLDQFNIARETTDRLEGSYVMGNRLLKFLSEVLPTHRHYYSKDRKLTKLRIKSQNDLSYTRNQVEDIALLLDKDIYQKIMEREGLEFGDDGNNDEDRDRASCSSSPYRRQRRSKKRVTFNLEPSSSSITKFNVENGRHPSRLSNHDHRHNSTGSWPQQKLNKSKRDMRRSTPRHSSRVSHKKHSFINDFIESRQTEKRLGDDSNILKEKDDDEWGKWQHFGSSSPAEWNSSWPEPFSTEEHDEEQEQATAPSPTLDAMQESSPLEAKEESYTGPSPEKEQGSLSGESTKDTVRNTNDQTVMIIDEELDVDIANNVVNTPVEIKENTSPSPSPLPPSPPSLNECSYNISEQDHEYSVKEVEHGGSKEEQSQEPNPMDNNILQDNGTLLECDVDENWEDNSEQDTQMDTIGNTCLEDSLNYSKDEDEIDMSGMLISEEYHSAPILDEEPSYLPLVISHDIQESEEEAEEDSCSFLNESDEELEHKEFIKNLTQHEFTECDSSGGDKTIFTAETETMTVDEDSDSELNQLSKELRSTMCSPTEHEEFPQKLDYLESRVKDLKVKQEAEEVVQPVEPQESNEIELNNPSQVSLDNGNLVTESGALHTDFHDSNPSRSNDVQYLECDKENTNVCAQDVTPAKVEATNENEATPKSSPRRYSRAARLKELKKSAAWKRRYGGVSSTTTASKRP